MSETGAVKTSLEADPRPKVRDVLFDSLGKKGKGAKQDDDDLSDENDW